MKQGSGKSNQYKNLKVRLNNGGEISLKNEIGSGSFSNVYQTTNAHYVAKVMNLNYMPSQRSFLTEKKYYELLGSHPNIIEFMAGQEINDGQIGLLIIENCPKGSLVDIMELTPKNQLSETQIIRVIYEVALGLTFIHKKKLIHRDIKIENILYSEDNHFKICDFGSMTNNIIDRIGNQKIQEMKEEIEKNTTPMYRCPEIIEPELFRDMPIGEKVDIFALGVLAYILCYKKCPFDTALAAINGFCDWPEFPVTSDEFHSLVMRMLSVSPIDRPTAKQIIEIIQKDLKFDYNTDGKIDPFIFSKSSQKEAKASWYQIINAKFFSVFFDTQGWIKGALQYDEFGPKQKYVRKLILKGWKKRPKIDKFYALLYNHWKENKNNTIINLKILILMHNYFKKGSPEAIKNPADRKVIPEKILDDILQHWQKIIKDGEIIKPKDPKRSQYTCTLIVNFSKFLLTKLKLNQKYSQYFEGNFSLNPFLESTRKKFKPLDPLLLPDLIEYLAVTLKFVNMNLLHQCQLWQIQTSMSLSVLDEIYCVLCLTMHLYKSFKLSTNFESDKYDKKDISQFIQSQDSNIEKMYQQAQLYFKRCSQIQDTGLPISTMIPKLPQDVIDYIKSIQILSNSEKSFSIFDHLNYKQNIYGLKLPLSYGPGVLDAIKVQQKIDFNSSIAGLQKQQPSVEKQQDLKPPQSAQNGRTRSANARNKKSLNSDDYDSDDSYNVEEQQKDVNIQNKKAVNSVNYLPESKIQKPYIPNPHLVLKDQMNKQPEIKFNTSQNKQKVQDYFYDNNMHKENEEASNLFQQFENANIIWDPSHPNLVEGYQKDQIEQKQFNDTSKGQAYFQAQDLNRSVRNENKNNINIFDIDLFYEQDYNNQTHQNYPNNNNQGQQFGMNYDQNQNNNNNIKQLNGLNKQESSLSDIFNNFGAAKNTNQNNDMNLIKNQYSYIYDQTNPFDSPSSNKKNDNQQGNQQTNLFDLYETNQQNQQLYQQSQQQQLQQQQQTQQQQQYQQSQYQMNYQQPYMQQQQQYQYYQYQEQQQQQQMQQLTPSQLQIQMLQLQLQQQQQQLQQQQQQLMYNGYQQQIYNLNYNNNEVNQNNQYQNTNHNNNNQSPQQQQQQSSSQKQDLQIKPQQIQQDIVNPFIHNNNNINSNNNSNNNNLPKEQNQLFLPNQHQIQINASPQMSPTKELKNQLPEMQQLNEQNIQNEGQTSRRSKQLIGADDDSEDEKQNVENNIGQNKIQRLGSENIPDDEAEALRPLDSFLGNSKPFIDPQSQMKRSISPFKNSNAFKSISADPQKILDKKQSNENNQHSIKIEKHPQLVKYIKDEVSSEFFDFIVDFSELTIVNKIGSGNSCEVFRGKCKNQDAAIKVIKLDNSDEVHLKEFQREIQALIKLKNHENLLQLIAISSQDNNFYIVTEYCKGGTLFELLHKKKKDIKFIKWEHRIRWLLDIAKGMHYLHSNNLIHRDLKSLNLLFDIPYDPKSDVLPVMKIADFGLTRVGSTQAVPFQSGVLGTFHWMAPEIMSSQPISTKSDVYSFSIVMWELAARETPYKDIGNVAAIIHYVSTQQGRPNLKLLPFDTPKFLEKLMRLCWQDDPTKRPKFDEIIKILENPQILSD